jgi:hypothetical protein
MACIGPSLQQLWDTLNSFLEFSTQEMQPFKSTRRSISTSDPRRTINIRRQILRSPTGGYKAPTAEINITGPISRAIQIRTDRFILCRRGAFQRASTHLNSRLLAHTGTLQSRRTQIVSPGMVVRYCSNVPSIENHKSLSTKSCGHCVAE